MKPLGSGVRWLAGALVMLLSACATPPKGEARHAPIAAAGVGLAGAAARPAAERWIV
jgi:hypothetical protein